jgi:hypothetical protein
MQQTRKQERNERWSGGSFKQQATHNRKYRGQGGSERASGAYQRRQLAVPAGGREDPGKWGPAGAALVFTSTSSIHGGPGKRAAEEDWTGGGGTSEVGPVLDSAAVQAPAFFFWSESSGG